MNTKTLPIKKPTERMGLIRRSDGKKTVEIIRQYPPNRHQTNVAAAKAVIISPSMSAAFVAAMRENQLAIGRRIKNFFSTSIMNVLMQALDENFILVINVFDGVCAGEEKRDFHN